MDDAQAEQLDGRLLTDFADSFYGYGTYKAPFWFVGMGEGGGGLVAQINARLEAWRLRGRREVEDLRSFHEAFGMVKFFQSPAVLQPTWNKLIRVVLSATGRPVTTEPRVSTRAVRQRRWGDLPPRTAAPPIPVHRKLAVW